MKIVAVALTRDSQRLRPGYPPRGSFLSLAPNVELCRLAGAIDPGDSLKYLDERTCDLDSLPESDVTLVHADVGCGPAAVRFAARHRSRPALILCGPQSAAWANNPPPPIRHNVLGEIALAWPVIREKLLSNSLPRTITAGTQPGYIQPPPRLELPSGLDRSYQSIQFVRGCHCSTRSTAFCREKLYFGEATTIRAADEIIGEVVSLPGKLIHLLDDDVAAIPEYYTDIFRLLWYYRRHWTVRASVHLLSCPDLIKALSRSGVRLITFNESLLQPLFERHDLSEKTIRRLHRSVKTLHSAKMLVGATVMVMPEDNWNDYRPLITAIRRIDIDFLTVLEPHTDDAGNFLIDPAGYAPVLTPGQPAWLKGRFYSVSAILNRVFRRPRRIGLYNTLFYCLPISLGHRQDYLEGIASLYT